VVSRKNRTQPSRSASTPPDDATSVRPTDASDDSSAYWVAVNAGEHRSENPGAWEAVKLIKGARLPRRHARIILFFLPSFRLLQQWRDSISDIYYIESKFYRAAARCQMDDIEKLHQAREEAADLPLDDLSGALPERMDSSRREQLRRMARALELEAAVRASFWHGADDKRSVFSANYFLQKDGFTAVHQVIKDLRGAKSQIEQAALNRALEASWRAGSRLISISRI
jgi:hypothetical protein